MTWVFHQVVDVRKGSIIPWIRDFMINEHGVRIEQLGENVLQLTQSFLYADGDLEIKFYAYRSKDGWIDYATPENPRGNLALGPVCEIEIQSSQHISRPVSEDEEDLIVRNITEFMLEIERLPLAVAPFPEKVVFTPLFRKALKRSRSAKGKHV